jgi:hypothetical protein
MARKDKKLRRSIQEDVVWVAPPKSDPSLQIRDSWRLVRSRDVGGVSSRFLELADIALGNRKTNPPKKSITYKKAV